MNKIHFAVKKAADYAAFLICTVLTLYLLSDRANAVDAKNKDAEITALRNIVASCLSDSTGKPIKIGDELFLCGIVSIGKYP